MKRTLPAPRRQDNRPGHAIPAWFVMSDEERLADPAPLLPYLPPASAIIVRRRDPLEAQDMARALTRAAAGSGITILLSASSPVDRLEAHGLHIPEAALGRWKRTEINRLQPQLVTTSAHGPLAAMRAAMFGADAVLVSPVFSTKSHEARQALGLMRFASIAEAAPLPVIALGGVGAAQIRRVFHAGAAGIAGIGLFQP